MHIKFKMRYKCKLTKGMQKRNLQKQMAFNEKLNKLLEEIQKKKPFNYDIVFTKNNEFKK